jgi:hypothetical protein
MSTTYAPIARPKKINVRLIIFLIVATAPVFIALYAFISYHGGISHYGNYDAVDLKALGNFPFDQTGGSASEIPAKWRALDGKRVQLEGYTWSPRAAAGDLVEFEFVYNRTKCCFSGPPLVQERVYAIAPKSAGVDMDYGRLTGILHVKVTRDKAGVIQSVYTMDVEKSEALD